MPRLIPHDHRWARVYDEATAIIGALLYGVLVWLLLTSLSSCAAVAEPTDAAAPVRSLEAFATLSALAVVIVVAVVRAARALVPWLTRDDPRAKLACQGIGLAAAVVCVVLGLGPSVDPLGAAHPLVAQVAGGVVVAALASWGRDGLARLPGAVGERES